MAILLLLIVVALLSYQFGRIGPDPLRPWEILLRKRAFEWRLHWIDSRIAEAQRRRELLLERYAETEKS